MEKATDALLSRIAEKSGISKEEVLEEVKAAIDAIPAPNKYRIFEGKEPTVEAFLRFMLAVMEDESAKGN